MQECTYNSMNEMMYTRIRTHTHTHTHTHTLAHRFIYIYIYIYIAYTSCQTDSRLCRRALDARARDLEHQERALHASQCTLMWVCAWCSYVYECHIPVVDNG